MANTNLPSQLKNGVNPNNNAKKSKKKRETTKANKIKTTNVVSLSHQSLLDENKASSQKLQTYYQRELNLLSKIDKEMLTAEQQSLKSLLAVKLAAVENLNQAVQHNWLVNIPALTDKDVELGYRVLNPKQNLSKQDFAESTNTLIKNTDKNAQ